MAILAKMAYLAKMVELAINRQNRQTLKKNTNEMEKGALWKSGDFGENGEFGENGRIDA